MNTSFDPLELANRRPEWSARQPVTVPQWIVAALLVLAVAAGFCMDALATARLLVALATLFYVAATLYKFLLVRASAAPGSSLRFTREEVDALPPRDWPVYSILVPMYKEAETLPQMIAGLTAIDYPADRKDIQLLLEEDDAETLSAARAMTLPPGFRITVVPPSFPRTKPKACNYGLHLARGQYLVIYDAEDRPEPLQLKQAVLAFEASPERIACIQSRLNFYNSRFNLLTRWFTADYSSWFDLCLPGLAAMDAVVPLGGTSNHFKTSILRDLMGWDAYNVTEDCDLGVRLCRAGYSTRMLDTTTWEEACSSLPFWIRQRTRWQKGYIQTWFVHMRRPLLLLRELGFRNFLHFQLLIGGSIFSSLINPIFWTLALLWFLVRPDGVGQLFPGPIFALGALNLFLGNFFFVYVNLLGCYRRTFDSLVWAVLLIPAYWVMMSVSGWRAFLQFFTNPFHWEKTQHGLSSSQNA
ncbi:MAG: glycosyltransferase [Kiritimatiellia bacterium]|jgi:cellulose synthase/poly-beta-1,6-N-acetylglucosamine synthase-like glycosyltransferase